MLLFWVSHLSLLISIVSVAIASSSRALLFAMSLLFILSREISTLSFYVNGFTIILLLQITLVFNIGYYH